MCSLMMVEEGYQEVLVRKQIAERVRKEIHRQIELMLERKIREISGELDDELEEMHDSSQDNQQARPDSGVTDVDTFESHAHETTVFLDSTDSINEPSHSRASILLNNLEQTADSLLNLRVERMRRAKKMQERRRMMNLPNCGDNDDGNNNGHCPYYGRGGASRADLYCCYALYMVLVILVFLFAIFYAWMPLITSAIEKRRKA